LKKHLSSFQKIFERNLGGNEIRCRLLAFRFMRIFLFFCREQLFLFFRLFELGCYFIVSVLESGKDHVVFALKDDHCNDQTCVANKTYDGNDRSSGCQPDALSSLPISPLRALISA
jgi:hypothetical protein